MIFSFVLSVLGLGLSADYLTAGRGPSLNDLHGAVSNSLASTDFHFSLDGTRLSNSRDSLTANSMLRASVSRKRALSSSPYSDSFDINTMIRFSPNSLATMVNGSRSSSAASGSYGHLSAGTLSPALGMHAAAAAAASMAASMAPHILQAHLFRASAAGLLHSSFPHHPHHHTPSPTSSMFSLGPSRHGLHPSLTSSLQPSQTDDNANNLAKSVSTTYHLLCLFKTNKRKLTNTVIFFKTASSSYKTFTTESSS